MYRNAKVYLVDDDEDICKSLTFLAESIGLEIECYSNAKKFLESYDSEKAGCLLLDVRMPGMSGLQLQEELKKRSSHKPIIFLTGHGDISMAVKAIKEGAYHFFTKPYNTQELLDCINAAIEEDLKLKKRDYDSYAYEEKLARLTPRESEILEWVVVGKTSRAIAELLGISHKTVELHRNKLMEKMEVSSSVELAALVYKNRQAH